MDLIDELQRDVGSHLTADVNGWKFTATYGELMTAIHAQAFVNANRDEKEQPDPVRLPMPWPENGPKTADVTPEERAALRAQLLKRSAFAS